MFWWCIIMPSCSCYQSMDMLLFELYIHFNDAFFSLPPRVIIAKLTISLCHHDNSILISLRFRWEMFLKSFSTAHFYTDKPKNQRLWLSSLYNSKTKKKEKSTPMPFSFLNALFRIFQKSMNFSAKIISFFAFRKQS